MKKILIITQLYSPETGGNASRIHDMSLSLAELGFEITVISPHPTYPMGKFPRLWIRSSHSKLNDVNLINLWTFQPNSEDPTFIARILYYLVFPLHSLIWIIGNKDKFDVVITTSPPIFINIPGFLGKIIFRKKWIFDVRDLWINASIGLGFLSNDTPFSKMAQYFERQSYIFADSVCVTTNKMADEILKSCPIENKICLVPNGVNCDLFNPRNVLKKDQIIYSGHLGHAQDLINVIYAMKIVSATNNLKLCIVGEGELLDSLKKLTDELNLKNTIIFRGISPREEIPLLLSESKIGIAPLKNLECLNYAAPTKIYEYMACGIPFIACGKGEVEFIAKESGAGIIAENSPESIANAILELVNNPKNMEKMGTLGKKFVEENYTRKSIAEMLKKEIMRF